MLNLIKRNTPEIADRFELEIIDRRDGKGVYEIEGVNGKIVLRGDCKISLAMAYYRYLRDTCKVNLSHCGNEFINVTEAPLPADKTVHIIEQEKRAYLNYCTLGYSACWWEWERWEREIDFMAMRGINMPLSVVGFEAVLFYTLKDLGYTDEGAMEFISGPSYWPWQMMTNLDSYFSLTDKAYIDKKLELGKKIINRELELGMTPIQQGYTGQVPRTILRVMPKTRAYSLPSWCGFPVTYQIDPLDANFRKFGLALLEKQRQLFGAHHYYACDPFHENEPPIKGDRYLHNVGKAISDMYTSFDSQAVWVMQSWSLREPIVKAVDKDRLLILDIDGSKCEQTDGFWGYNFISGTLHNFGDRNSLHGSIKALADNPFMQKNQKYPNEIGTGLFMEGLFQNPLYYDLASDMLTRSDNPDLDGWLADYARRRYSSDEECLVQAAKLLRESCYSEKCVGRETGSVICARPATELRHTAPNDVFELRYDNKTLLLAAQKLLEASDASSDGYRYDVCDITRQVLSNYAKVLYRRSMDAFNQKDINKFERSVNAFVKLLEDVDRLLSTRPELCLSTHLKEARDYACCDRDKQNFEINELCLLTIWGPMKDSQLYDYAWKEWGGLIKTYYLPRWYSFFEQLAVYFKKRKCNVTTTKRRHGDREDYSGTPFYKNVEKFEKNWLSNYKPEAPSQEDTLEIARELIEKYAPLISES